MGKSLDELGDIDGPPATPTSPSLRSQAGARAEFAREQHSDAVRCFLEEIADVRGSDEAGWADATLRGIYETVLKTWRVTEGQERAVRNIARAVRQKEAERAGERRTRYSRRYEGWQR